ncbi:hypothetical protein PVK06_041316 [Gossypium arboreum]|uniref:(+)-delta-cadinene synthase n=1 Tax=Gossypium arboreum TaxID=29729 RepID=A0ABR0N7W0_GOSAR|nr:hypothetical protein PVK06_041316 [Gossypium arboreum]
MSSPISTNLVPSQHGNTSKENRHLSKFKPSVWGNIFLSSPPQMDMDAGTQQQYEESKQEVRRMCGLPFQKEIKEALQIIYHHHCNHIEIDGDDLYTTAVRFRLQREHGFDVHCATFNKFKDKKGNFKESLIGDVKGMLKLYEAAHFQRHGENILEEALSFTTFHLKLAETTVDYPLSTQIANALKRPLRKRLPRLIARSYISIYEGYGTQDEILMKFAKLDFKILQHLHKKEINKINRWDTNCIDQLPDYMKLWYSETLSVYKDMEDLMSKEGKSYRVQVAIEAMKRQSQVYYVEAKWLHENYIPTMEEYMPIALVSCGYWNLTMSSFVGMEDSITKEAFNWAFNDPKIVRASSTICRLMSDIVGHKDINEDFLKPTAAPTSALNRILNLARVIDLLYTGEDAYTQVGESAKSSITDRFNPNLIKNLRFK